MGEHNKLSVTELLEMDNKSLVSIIVSLQGQISEINGQLGLLIEQMAVANQRAFGRKSEKASDNDQLSFFDLEFNLFNEAEADSDDSREPDITEVTVSGHTRKVKTSREDQLEGLPARVYNHVLSKDELTALFPDGYKELPEEIYKRLSIIPRTFLVDEHHVHVYASKKNDGTIIRADRPADLFRNSIATPSLVSAIITAKYASHTPLERQSTAFKNDGIKLETNTLANWVILSSEYYLSLIYEALHKDLYRSKVIHADETPCRVVRDGRDTNSKSYMWVYHSGTHASKNPIVIYDYQQTRHHYHPEEFLKDYSGILVTDGYQAYHTLDKKRDDLQIAGCWVHAKRKFAELIKATSSNPGMDSTVAAQASSKISNIFHQDNKLDTLSKKERETQRLIVIKPLVDDFFAWAKEQLLHVPAGGITFKGLNYCINQEQFLRIFLKDGNVPMDNNLAERAIRPFTLGRKNWTIIDSLQGAKASAMIYSIVETAKANNLRVYDYVEHLLSELSKHQDDNNLNFIEDLLPWSESIQRQYHIKQKV